MRNIQRLTLSIMSLLICTVVGTAQEQPSAPSSQLSEQSLATVYVYRLDEGVVVANLFFWFRKTRPVYFREHLSDEPNQKNKKIAALKNKHYFILRLPPGKYIFDTRLMWGNLKLEVAAGGEYHLRLDQGNDCPDEDSDYTTIQSPCQSKNASIERVSPEQWRKDMSVLKPIKSGEVKDRRLIIIPTGPPSNNSMRPTASLLGCHRELVANQVVCAACDDGR